MSGMILTKSSFWWGASLAALPALAGLPAVWYAGTAVVNVLWRLFLGRDSSEGVALLGGVVYGLTAGLVLQCFVVATAVDTIPQLSWSPGRSRGRKIISWFVAELVVIPLSVVMTTAAYAAPALLAWVLRLTSITGDGGK